MTTAGISENVLSALREIDTPTVCNAIELFNVRPRNTGYMDHTIKACFGHLPPMVGYALTSAFRSLAPPRGGDAYASLNEQVERFEDLPGPPVVVFQDLDEPTTSATFGEVMCSTYQAFGAQGLITSGTGRDLDQVEAIKFPAFTSGTTCAHGYCHILSVGAPVTVGGIVVYQGDLLHGDRNGVTTIPHEIATELPEACREIMAAESIVIDYVRSGRVTSAGLAEARQACGDAMDKVARQLQGKR